ncbi:bile acid:sodium symporter [Patescibacteria group bacterium]|nr:bile acid:sodium symporter [Patescibacteria group bacterium]MBU1705177.1 bile acid:sodium symporter [Patescibacteria group bacterium]
MNRITPLLVALLQSYFFIIVVALSAALLFPNNVIGLAPFGTFFLQIIFFLTSLKLDPQEVLKAIRNWPLLLAANAFTLIILPAVTYVVARSLVPDLAVPLMLIAALPTGMTAPLLCEVVGGRVGLALVVALTTSLLAPLSIPLVVGTLASTAVNVSMLTMFWSLVKVIIMPFILAQIVKKLWDRKIRFTFFTFKPVSLILLGLLIAGAVAKQADYIIDNFGNVVISQLIVLSIYMLAVLLVGYYVAFWRQCDERATVAVSMAYMNFTLGIYLAGQFFNDPNVLLASVLVIFPWALSLFPFKWIVRRFVCSS